MEQIVFLSGSEWTQHETVTISNDKFLVENYSPYRVGPNVTHEGAPISYIEARRIALRKQFERFLQGEVNGTDQEAS